MTETPFQLIGGQPVAERLARRFYEVMEEREPELLATHERDETGQVTERTRKNFELFLVEWLGGPAVFTPVHGHPRLRMRHARVPVTKALRDAWARTMSQAMEDVGVSGEVRTFLEERFLHVANFLRNVPEAD